MSDIFDIFIRKLKEPKDYQRTIWVMKLLLLKIKRNPKKIWEPNWLSSKNEGKHCKCLHLDYKQTKAIKYLFLPHQNVYFEIFWNNVIITDNHL